jgi:tripartite-type tricarboxylate transporter receptor subunit TctC
LFHLLDKPRLAAENDKYTYCYFCLTTEETMMQGNKSFLTTAGRWLCFSLAAVLLHQPALAAWPEKPVTVIVPFAPGSTGDVAIRLLAPALQKQTGMPWIIESRAGAAGNIGAAAVQKAAPDGHTLLLAATNNLVINQFVMPMTFDPLKSFTPISVLAEVPPVLVMNASLPPKSLQDFIAYAKANPGNLSYGSPGAGTIPHLAVELFKEMTKTDILHVPYRGSGPAIADVLGNQVQLTYVSLSNVQGHIQAGKMRALAVSSKRRLPTAPNVPTFAEAGLPEFSVPNWWALVAPAGTDQAIVDRIAKEVRAALSDPQMQKQFIEKGLVPIGNTPQEFATELQKEARKWAEFVKKHSIRSE